MSENGCLFDRIIAGEIPCWKIHEDEHTFAFLDINPLSRGHALIVPKTCCRTLDEVTEQTAAALGVTVRRVGTAVARATGCEGWNVLQNNGEAAGQEVGHVHFHIIPRRSGDGLGYRWSPKPLDSDAAADLTRSIQSHLNA